MDFEKTKKEMKTVDFLNKSAIFINPIQQNKLKAFKTARFYDQIIQSGTSHLRLHIN